MFKRRVEHFVLQQIARVVEDNGFEVIAGEFIPTTKNDLVKDLLRDLGFFPDGPEWCLEAGSIPQEENHIKKTMPRHA